MVENANSSTDTTSRYGNHASTEAYAIDVSCTPSPTPSTVYMPVITITRAVMVQMTTVSMNGSQSATRPSAAGSLVRDAERAIAADPTPAASESPARRKPWISTPMKPPYPAYGVNAPSTMVRIAGTTFSMLANTMYTLQATYSTAMTGTSLLVTRAIDFRPPMMTTATSAAIAR